MATYRTIELREDKYSELDLQEQTKRSLREDFEEVVKTNKDQVEKSIKELYPTYSKELQESLDDIEKEHKNYLMKYYYILDELRFGKLKLDDDMWEKDAEGNPLKVIKKTSIKACLKRINKKLNVSTEQDIYYDGIYFNVKPYNTTKVRWEDMSKTDKASETLEKLNTHFTILKAKEILYFQRKHRDEHDEYTIKENEIIKFQESTGIWLDAYIHNRVRVSEERMNQVYEAMLEMKEEYQKMQEKAKNIYEEYDYKF